MAPVVVTPSGTYFCTLNFQPGENINITTTVKDDAERLDVIFKCDEGPTADIGLFIAINFEIDEVVVTSRFCNEWGNIKKYVGLCANQRPDLEVVIQCTHNVYKVSINGSEVDEYLHEIPWYNITHMAVCGDIKINKITYIPSKQVIMSGEAPPPNYEMSTRSDYGSVNIPIVLSREDQVVTIYPAVAPLLPGSSTTRKAAKTNATSSAVRVIDEDYDTGAKKRVNLILITLSVLTAILLVAYFFQTAYPDFFNPDRLNHTTIS